MRNYSSRLRYLFFLWAFVAAVGVLFVLPEVAEFRKFGFIPRDARLGQDSPPFAVTGLIRFFLAFSVVGLIREQLGKYRRVLR